MRIPEFSFPRKIYRLLLLDIVQCYRLMDAEMRRAVWWLGLMMLAQAMMELVTIEGIRQLGVATSNQSGLADEFPWKWLFGEFPALGAWASVAATRCMFLAACFVALLIAIKNAITWLAMWNTCKVSEHISFSIAEEIMRRYLYGEYRWHLSSEGNAALQMMLWRNNLASLLVQQLSALTGFLACAILFTGLIIQEPVVSLLAIGIIGISATFLYAGLRKKIDLAASEAAAAGSEETSTVVAATRGIRDVIIYGQQKTFLKKLADILRRAVKPKIFLSIANSIPSNILEVLGFLLIPLTIALMAKTGASIEAIISAVMMLVLTAWRILPYLNRGVGQMVAIRALRPTALPVLEFLQMLRGNPLQNCGEGCENIIFERGLELVGASFTYPGAEKPGVADINMNIPRGALVGLIGPSGAGKSTLCNLLSGLCAPDSGHFLVDGRRLDEAEMGAFRRHISFVPQAPFLMSGSLAENVAFSQWGKAWDEDAVIEACRKASLDFIPLNGRGILLNIGENGAGLSGGQAQRVAIARALYAKPEIIIFDEATSALDSGNEGRIVAAIENLRGSITCIIIAHRLTTVEHCDIIYWIDGGKIVASGTPTEILPRYSASL